MCVWVCLKESVSRKLLSKTKKEKNEFGIYTYILLKVDGEKKMRLVYETSVYYVDVDWTEKMKKERRK